MELKDLVGSHELSGIEEVAVEIEYFGDKEKVNGVRFILDGVTYQATEDESDGYRSYLRELEVTTEPVANVFTPHKVLVVYSEGDDDDVITLLDCVTGKPVLKLGTESFSDYYPMCIMSWTPDNLAANAGRRPYEA